MTIKEDLSNKIFGRLTVLKRDISKIGNWQGSFWICECSCGKIKSISRGSLKKGTISCGCFQKEKATLRGMPGETEKKNRWISKYKKRAKNKNICFTLTDDEFFNICQQECFYCGDPPAPRISQYLRKGLGTKSTYNANGIDRIDSNKGYEKNNSVACCTVCNFMKTNKTFEDFILKIKKIAKKHNL